MTFRNSTLYILHFTLLCSACAAEQSTLGPNDFSYYRWTGAGETFAMRTASVTTNAASRQKFWTQVAADKIPVIYQLTFPKTPGWKQKLPKTPDEAVAAIDSFFAPADGVAPCPEKLFAVTPCEENVTWEGQTEVQDAIAKHLRSRYGVKTYQWLTEPMKPTLAMQADGWVFDAYCITDPDAFYAHVESFVMTGVPVVPCIWASGHFCKYHLDRTWDDLVRFTVERMDICRALGLPVMVFAVGGRAGSVGLWFGKTDDPGERYYRETIRNYLAAVPTMPAASWKPAPKRWNARIRADGSVAANVDLKSFDLVRETEFDDVRAWRLGRDGLSLLRERGRLTWRVLAHGRIRRGRFSLRHSPGAKGSFCGLPLSPSGLTEAVAEDFDSRLLLLEAESPATLVSLSLEGEGEGAAETVDLAMDASQGRTDYKCRMAFDGAEGSLSGAGGRVARRRIVRRIPLPGCSGKVAATTKVFVEKAHGGAASVSAFASLDGSSPLATAKSDPKLRFQDVVLECAVPAGTPELFVVFDLAVTCGVETGKAAATVKSCDFTFRPIHP